MARPYSEDLRARVVGAVEGGASRRAAAARYQVSVSFVVKLMQRWRRTGSLAPGWSGGRRTHRLAEHGELVRQLVAGQPDLTLEELSRRLAAQGVQVGRSSIDRFLKAIGLTRKKDAACGRAEPARRRHSPSRVARRAGGLEPRPPRLRR
jgi:transposase